MNTSTVLFEKPEHAADFDQLFLDPCKAGDLNAVKKAAAYLHSIHFPVHCVFAGIRLAHAHSHLDIMTYLLEETNFGIMTRVQDIFLKASVADLFRAICGADKPDQTVQHKELVYIFDFMERVAFPKFEEEKQTTFQQALFYRNETTALFMIARDNMTQIPEKTQTLLREQNFPVATSILNALTANQERLLLNENVPPIPCVSRSVIKV